MPSKKQIVDLRPVHRPPSNRMESNRRSVRRHSLEQRRSPGSRGPHVDDELPLCDLPNELRQQIEVACLCAPQ